MMTTLAPLCLTALLPLLATTAPASANGSSTGTYSAIFPDKVAVANLAISIPSEAAVNARHERVIARGRLTLPKTCQMTVELCYDGLKNMQSLQQLEADQVVRFSAAKLELGDSQLEQIKRFKSIVLLYLDDTIVSDKSLPTIASFIHLSVLRINGTDITGSGFSCLKNMVAMKDLSIKGINLKPGSLSTIKTWTPNLTSIDASKCGLTAVDIPPLAQLTKLETLDLAGNKTLDDACIKQLQPLVNLQQLRISDTSITAKSLPDIYKLPALKTVVIRSRQFWLGSKQQKTRLGITFKDIGDETRIPIEVFSPPH